MNAVKVEREITEEEYRELLNELYPEVCIGYLTFDPGRIVEELDPTAFRCGLTDYESTLDCEWQCSECAAVYGTEEEAEECCEEI